MPVTFACATSVIAEARVNIGGEAREDKGENGEIGAGICNLQLVVVGWSLFVELIAHGKSATTNPSLYTSGQERLGKYQEIKIPKIRANLRIGTHNKDILSILFGSLLGDAHAEFRLKGKGTRINFYQEGSHVSYLIWLHKLISELGYCNTNLPKITTRLGKKGVVRKIIRFNTWTYSSFNWIHELFYKDGKNKGVPSNIADYLTPLALAIWIMDDGGKLGQGLKLSTNSFSFSDCNFLVKVLYENFKLKASVQSAGVENQYIIYIWKDSMPLLREIVLPYVHPSMKYKLINK